MTSKLKVVAQQVKTILSTEVSAALKQAGEATYNSDQAFGLSKRANKSAALALKKIKYTLIDFPLVILKRILMILSEPR